MMRMARVSRVAIALNNAISASMFADISVQSFYISVIKKTRFQSNGFLYQGVTTVIQVQTHKADFGVYTR